MDKTLERLIEGNLQYRKTGTFTGDVSKQRRAQNATRQKPFAAIVTCSDSRVIPETIFGAGIGELFVVRTAGNVIGTAELASLTYAVAHLGVRVVIVMGHTGCGAIDAALNGEFEGAVGAITRPIKEAIGKESTPDQACVKNVQSGVITLKKALDQNNVSILGMVYDIVSGTVKVLE